DFDHLRRFLADDQIETEVRLAGADAGVHLAGRELDGGAQRERRRVLAVLGPEAVFDAEVEVADVVAAPGFVGLRIAGDDAAGRVSVAVEGADAAGAGVWARTAVERNANATARVEERRTVVMTAEPPAVSANYKLNQ